MNKNCHFNALSENGKKFFVEQISLILYQKVDFLVKFSKIINFKANKNNRMIKQKNKTNLAPQTTKTLLTQRFT